MSASWRQEGKASGQEGKAMRHEGKSGGKKPKLGVALQGGAFHGVLRDVQRSCEKRLCSKNQVERSCKEKFV